MAKLKIYTTTIERAKDARHPKAAAKARAAKKKASRAVNQAKDSVR